MSDTTRCPYWGKGPCGYNDEPCARGCKYVPAGTVTTSEPRTAVDRPVCGCGNPLLLIRPGRTQCERCRLASGATA